ncbi:acyl carrier protein [Burkholderia sp. 22PA0106]|uniref:acyl carrier protein n=1 Tax=Burkholderia sp. 22PA0106 TaxID=3237371 RepID=UPI0039C2A3B9
MNNTQHVVRNIIADLNCLDVPVDAVTDRTDLYAVGLTSLTSVQLLLEIERAFDIHVPDAMLTYEMFESIDALADAIGTLQQADAA